MKNNLLPIKAKIIKKVKQNDLINCFQLKFDSKVQKNFQFLAGQFVMIGLPGFGEAAFTLSSDPRKSSEYFEVCIRTAGELTDKINQMKKNDYLYIRGPFGNGFPEVKSNLIIIGGGCGFIPLKSVVLENIDRQDIKLQTLMGCRNKNTLIFYKEFSTWKNKFDFQVILEEDSYLGFSKEKGFVTDLINNAELLEDAVVFCCGPEVMYKYVGQALIKKGINPENIYFSLERRMYCGSGQCQHCTCGEKYVCKDGPVFSYDYLKKLPKNEIDL
jgi:sulfhydrogenase subunit gamma (sulfur reductase)